MSLKKIQNPNYCKKSEASLGCLEKPKKNSKRHLLDLLGHQREEFFFVFVFVCVCVCFFFFFFFGLHLIIFFMPGMVAQQPPPNP